MDHTRLLTAAIIGLALTAGVVLSRSANQNARGDVSTFYTDAEYNYTKWLQMVYRSDVVFKVKACSDAHIALSYQRDNYTEDVTEVVLAGWHNSLSAIRNGTYTDKDHFMNKYTPNLLHCAEFRTFWISWRHGYLRVGRGPISGEQEIMRFDKTNTGQYLHRIEYVGFSTGFGYTGAWQIEENEGYHLYVYTPNDFNYNYMWKSVTAKSFPAARFRVRACNDVHVNLSPKEGQVGYEIVLGGWENRARSAIRLNWDIKVDNIDADILSCDEFKFFWISWLGGTLMVGKGERISEVPFLQWRDPSPRQINHISVSTGYGADGLFIFEEDLENRFALISKLSNVTSPKYDMFVETPRQEYMTFRVQACSDAYLGISMSPGSVDENTQHMYIGGQGNTRSGVLNGYSSAPLIEVYTPGILSCDYTREFWMTWFNNHVQLGRGLVYGQGKFLEFDLPSEVRYINSIGLANTRDNDALWVVRRLAGDNIFLRTTPNNQYLNLWVSTFQDFFTTFRLRSCRNSNILLSSVDGETRQEAWEVIIGQDSYKTVIREMSRGGVVVEEADTPEVTHCSEFRTFWVGWLDGYIRVGRGQKYGYREIISMSEPIPIRVNALSISTKDVTGSWQFESDRGDYFEAKSPGSEVTEKWMNIFEWHTWMFFQVSGAGACLVLSPTYQDASRSYKICLGLSGNTKVVLYKDNQELQSTTRGEILDLLDARDWWVHWEDGVIAFGHGKFRGTELLLEYTDPSPYEVKAAALVGLDSFSAEWRMWEYHVREFTFDTSVYRSFSQLWLAVRHRYHLSFSLRTCGYGEILMGALMHGEQDDYTYTLVIQDKDSMTSIWEGVKRKKFTQVPTSNLLDCEEMRDFWLSWYKGHIVLGTGKEHGKNVVIAHQDLNGLDIRALAFTTVEETGSWKFPMNQYAATRQVQSGPPLLSGGEIAGVAIGTLVIIVLFLAAVVVIVRPPEPLRPYLSSTASSSNGRSIQTPASNSFENPMAEIDLVESGK